jgi:colicin import membrane protein
MARKLKVFTTSAGFFDLAVSAPSMKAALEAWGAGANLFHHGFARQSDDPAIVKAAMARPGVVLRRPVGTDRPFTEEAEASEAPFEGKVAKKPKAARPKVARPKGKPVAEKPPSRKEERAAARAFEQERKRRERQEAAARRKEAARRDRAIAAATAALAKAEARHEAATAEIEQARAALDAKADRETSRWRRERETLEERLRQARMPRHLRPV